MGWVLGCGVGAIGSWGAAARAAAAASADRRQRTRLPAEPHRQGGLGGRDGVGGRLALASVRNVFYTLERQWRLCLPLEIRVGAPASVDS